MCLTWVEVLRGTHPGMKRVTLSLPESLLEWLDAEADEEDLSRSEYVRNLLSQRRENGEEENETGVSIEEHYQERENRIRAEARVEYLEREVERLREERDRYHARYNESQGKLKVHNSEKGFVERLRNRFRS